MDSGFGRKIEQLDTFNDRVLAVGQLCGSRSSHGWFRPRDVANLLEDLRVHGGNVSRSLGLLDAQKLVVKSPGRNAWSLTPRGEERVLELTGEIDTARLEAQLEAIPGARLGSQLHTLIPPFLAPHKWTDGIERMLKEYPFESNVFLMGRFPTDENDPNHGVIERAKEVLGDYGFTLHVASRLTLDEDLWGNIAAHMWACQFGIGLFENRSEVGLNHNLLLEIGSMVTLGRRCMLMRDHSAPEMPSDLVGQIYSPVDFDDLDSVANAVSDWVTNGINLRP